MLKCGLKVNKINIGYVLRAYRNLTETFIYNGIENLEKYNVIFLTKYIRNWNVFPTDSPIFSLDRLSWLEQKRDLFLGRLSFFEKIIRQYNIKLLHAHFGQEGIFIMSLSRRLGIPLITSFGGIDASMLLKKPFYLISLKRLFKIGKVFLAKSNAIKDTLIMYGCPPQKIITYYSGVEVERVSSRRKLKETDKKIILMCGRCTEKKGFKYGIEAFYKVFKKNQDIELRIIGDGPLRKKLESQVKRLGLSSCVKFFGFLPNDSVMEEMAKATIFLCPSITAKTGDKEGIPNVIKEAMATKVPVVSTWHGGIPELVEDGVSGFLVQEKDVDGLSKRLLTLIDDPELCKRLGEAGYEKVYEKFNITKQIKELERIYDRCMGIG